MNLQFNARGLGKESRNAIFDIFCQNEKREYFIVEMQKQSKRGRPLAFLKTEPYIIPPFQYKNKFLKNLIGITN